MARDRRAPAANAAVIPRRRRDVVADSATADDQCHPRKIFVGGLSHTTTTQDIREYFAHYGNVVDAIALRWPDGCSRGFGYVTFSDAGAAAAVLKQSHKIDGRDVDVKRAVPGSNKLFVGGLPQNATAAELREHFEAFGIVSDAVVMMDPSTNRSRGFGFVCFLPGVEGAAAEGAAIEQYEHHRIRGKWIEVKSAAPSHKLAGREGVRNCRDGTPSTTSSDGLSPALRTASSSPPASAILPPSPSLLFKQSASSLGSSPLPPPGLQRGGAFRQHRSQSHQDPQLKHQRRRQKPAAVASESSAAATSEMQVVCLSRSLAALPPTAQLPHAPEVVESVHGDAGAPVLDAPVLAKGFFDASADLQRSLEQLLRLRCGSPEELAKGADFTKPMALASAAPLGFFESDQMSPMKVEW